ncbi:MAG: alpha-amylase family protein [Tetrasphaera sp.]
MPGWVEHVLWWQVYPLGFVGAAHEPGDAGGDGRVRHRLGHIEAWLDHAIGLGLNGLLLGPIFDSGTHGYDTIDYRRLDPRLGDDADFDHLVTACRDRGLRILLDGVFNHVGTEFPLFRQAVEQGEGSAASRAFRFHWGHTNELGLPAYDCFEGHQSLVELNHDAPEVVDLVVEVMTHWLGRGIDGWRLDAAYAVPESFWAQVLPRVRESHPDAYILGEVIHGDYPAFVAGSGVDSVTQYELWKAIWSSLQSVNFWELSHALGRHDGFLDSFVPQTFLGNHDVTRIATQIGDARHIGHAYAVLLTLGGTPSIYYGDEMGYTGTKEQRVGGDDQVRPVMPRSPSELALGHEVFAIVRELVCLRRRHPWLHRGRTRDLVLTNPGYAFEVIGDGLGERIVVCLNISGETMAFDDLRVTQVLAGVADIGDAAAGRVAGGRRHTAQVSIAPHSWAVLG